MTETTEIPTDQTAEDAISDALRLIDKSLSEMMHRELVSTDEVSDLLLDMRTLLSTQQALDGETVGA